jgi:hypothetical protein
MYVSLHTRPAHPSSYLAGLVQAPWLTPLQAPLRTVALVL